MEKYKKEIPGNIKIHQPQKITLHGTSHILRKVALHEIDLYLIVTLGPRNGLGYYVVLWYYIREDSNNGNNYTFDVLLKRYSTLLHRYSRGGSRGRVQGVRTPPPPEMTCGFLIQLVFCIKKNYVVYWC